MENVKANNIDVMENLRIKLHHKYPFFTPVEIEDVSNSICKYLTTKDKSKRIKLFGYLIYTFKIGMERSYAHRHGKSD